ncbi:MAG: DUF4296 domain-containing protein [Balneolaceae bacterium]
MSSKWNILLLPIFFAGLLLAGCDSKPAELLEEEVYIDVFAELLIVQQLNPQQLESASRDSFEVKVFDKFNVSEESFRISHDYYQRDAEGQLLRIERIQQQIETERQRLQEESDRLTSELERTLQQENKETDVPER